MILEIQNPSDEVTIETDDIVVAGVAMLLVGRGQYGLENEEGETVFPIMLFGGVDKWLEDNGIKDLHEYLQTNKDKLVKVLKSCVYGRIGSRQLFESAISKMTLTDALKYREEWNDKKRSSMNNIGKNCLYYAEKMEAL
jgi:hypothetical protein